MNPEVLAKELKNNGVDFYTGVPDSFLYGFCSYIQEYIDAGHHVTAANEGNAIGIAAGHYLASGKVPVVYMQNSGMGNAFNPLVSLADKHVYAIPMILLIGWRGEPGIGDHEQHKTQGELTTTLLNDMGIPYRIVGPESSEQEHAKWAADQARRLRQPVALLVRKGALSGEKKKPVDDSFPMRREDVIRIFLDYMPKDTIFVATTGRATRELYILREERGEGHEKDFLNVGSMGHASSVAMGIALEKPQRQVVCFDGDAAAMMHMGAFAAIDKRKIPNFLHVILNNGSHESVGGQPSVGHEICFTGIAENCRYQTVGKAIENAGDLIDVLQRMESRKKAGFIDVKIRSGLRDGLGPLKASLKAEIDLLHTELCGD